MSVAEDEDGSGTPVVSDVAARRSAGLVAAVAGLVLIPWFWLAHGVTTLRTESPEPSAPGAEFVTFYADNLSRLPWQATAYTLQWVIILVLVVAVVRAAGRRAGPAAPIAVALVGAATAVYVLTEGLGVWPALTTDLTAANLGRNLDPGVAKALVSSRDGLHMAAAVLLGVSLLVTAGLLARSDLWGRVAMAVLTALTGLGAVLGMILGPESVTSGLVVLWAPVLGVLLLVARHRLPARPG